MADVDEEMKEPAVAADDNPETEDEESVEEAEKNVDKKDNTTTPAKKTTPSKSKTPSSPKISYIALVQEAIEKMKDRTGSSQIAIQKYISSNHPELPADKIKQRLLHTLKTGCANKRFIKVKCSFKIHPDAKKKKKKAVKKKAAAAAAAKKAPEKKAMTKQELAALREKERKAALEKERQDKIRKRKFPMDDLELIKEDKELRVSVSLPSRPSLPVVLADSPAVCKSDTMGSGILDDAFHVYHFFRGDVGWGRLPQNKSIVAPFTLEQWLGCIQQVLSGGAKKSRMLPPLMTHLFVVALQRLVPKELEAALTPASWSEVLMLYMDAMERYYTTESSLDSAALPGLGIDADYILHVTDEHKVASCLEPPTKRESNFYLQGPLAKIQDKLFTNDPWLLSAEELLSLLKALVDDLLATQPLCSEELDNRLQETYELLRTKRDADALYRKLQNLRRKEENEKKESEEKGEKPTRSNMKLPSVSDAKLESARRSQQKANDAYEKACRSKRTRTEPIGEDRHYNAYYHFWHDSENVYVAQRSKALPSPASFNVPGVAAEYRTVWHSIDKRSVLEKYIESLDVRGKRENNLKEGIEPAVKTVFDDIKVMNEKKALLKSKQGLQNELEKARLKCEVGRKSGRLAAQSEQEFFDLQEDIKRLEHTIEKGEAEPEKPDFEVTTGLAMLREFDRVGDTTQCRRATTRGIRKEDLEGEQEDKHTPFKCSKLWSSGNIDGSGVIGSIVWDLLELEERIQKLAAWDKDRQSWISGLETATHSWHMASPPSLEADKSQSPSPPKEESSSDAGTDAKKQRRQSSETNSQSVHQVLSMMKQPLLQLEQRVFEMSGLAVAFQDSIDADDNMSSSPDDEDHEELLQVAWKRLIYRLNRLQAKAHSKIRHLVVEAIAAARKAQQATVVSELRGALLQFHPEAAGACKGAALEVLEKHGGYDDDDDDDDDEEMDDVDDIADVEKPKAQSEAGLSSVLSFEGVIMNSCLDGQEDAGRDDWIAAVKKCKTISKFAALVAAFRSKASERLDKIESEEEALANALESWEKSSSLRKKSSAHEKEPTEIWTNVTFTDDFCLAKVEDFPWWPAKKCIVKDENVAKSLANLGRSVVSLVGESGGLRVVVNEKIAPYSETPPEEVDLNTHSKDVRNQLEDCRAMARRIIRGKENRSMNGQKSKSSGKRDSVKDEKKVAT